jgi:hypothetical protein
MMQLFTRDGAEFNGTPSTDDAGRPVRFVSIGCDRCHVINGQRLWIMGTENGQPYSRTGFACWTCGNTGVRGERKERLYTAEQLARVNKAAATRAANKAEQGRIAREQFLAAQDAARAAFLAEHADFIAKVAALRGEDEDGFFNRVHLQLVSDLRAPTAALVQIVEAETAKRSANASSRWIGNIGDKVTLTLTVERIIVLRSHLYGDNYINICRTQDGNVVTYKGRVDLGSVGAACTVKATVAEHEWYDGVQQTAIQRPKVQ